jgi:hypothetical protein
MKKLMVILIILIVGLSYKTIFAQIAAKYNISSQPMWGPVGYEYVEYYYFPDIDMFYNVPKQKFISMQNGRWISRSYLSAHYNLYSCRIVVINEPKPYLNHKDYKTIYAIAKDHSIQLSIRDSHEPRYFENKDHPEHSKWKNFKKFQEENQKVEEKYNKSELSNK